MKILKKFYWLKKEEEEEKKRIYLNITIISSILSYSFDHYIISLYLHQMTNLHQIIAVSHQYLTYGCLYLLVVLYIILYMVQNLHYNKSLQIISLFCAHFWNFDHPIFIYNRIRILELLYNLHQSKYTNYLV